MKRGRSILMVGLSAGLILGLSAPASAATWRDTEGDAGAQEADIVEYELTNSVQEITYTISLSQASYAAREQSVLTSEVDLGANGTIDLFVSAQAPYRTARVEAANGKKLCDASAAYTKTSSGADITVVIPGACAKYAARVAATHRFLVSTDEENGLDEVGSLDDVVTRKMVAFRATSKRKGKTVTVSMVSDPLYKGRSVAVQIRKKSKWVTATSLKLGSSGSTQAKIASRQVPKGSSGRVVWGRTVLGTFRSK